MRCPTCHGIGRVFDLRPIAGNLKPDSTTAELGAELERAIAICPECHGSRVAHCCEGLCEQPETEK